VLERTCYADNSKHGITKGVKISYPPTQGEFLTLFTAGISWYKLIDTTKLGDFVALSGTQTNMMLVSNIGASQNET
jgi:hypothetical protein